MVIAKALGWTELRLSTNPGTGKELVIGIRPDPTRPPGRPIPSPVPRYSTDIAAAWEVVDAIRYGHGGGLLELVRNGTDTWFAQFSDRSRVMSAETAPLSICLAALKEIELPRAPSMNSFDQSGR